MKRVVTLIAGTLLTAAVALVFSSCTKQCSCYMVTHYIDYSTNQHYTETVDEGTACSSLDGEYFHEDAYGNPISVDVVSCHEM